MSFTTFSVSDVQTLKLWSKRLLQDNISNETLIGGFLSDKVLVRQDELQRSAGDQIKIHLRRRLSTKGFIGDEMATSNEKSLTYFQDSLLINEQREVVQNSAKNTIGQQRVLFNLEEDTYETLRDWFREKMIVGTLNQLVGNTAPSITYDGDTYTGADLVKITGMNAARAPSGTGRIFRPNSLTTDQAVNGDTTATAKLSHILEMEKFAEKTRPYFKPLDGKMDGESYKYLYLVHTDVFNQLLEDTTAPYQFRDIYYNRLAAGKMMGFGRSGVFSQTKIMSIDKLPFGVHSSTGAEQTNTRRGVFLGREAGALAFGQGFSDGKDTIAGFMFKTDQVDVQKLDRIAVVGIWGVVKTVFDSIDYGTIATTHYTA